MYFVSLLYEKIKFTPMQKELQRIVNEDKQRRVNNNRVCIEDKLGYIWEVSVDSLMPKYNPNDKRRKWYSFYLRHFYYVNGKIVDKRAHKIL